MLTHYKNVSVLVTGAWGFIGSHLVRRLLELGARVHTADLNEKTPSLLSDIQSDVIFHHLDVRDQSSVTRCVQDANPVKVFHLASLLDTTRSFDLLDEMVDVHTLGTLRLLKAIMNSQVDCFINTGTCEEYGTNIAPFSESLRESPVSPYSASKAAGTLFCRLASSCFNLPIVTLRPFLTYGPGQDNHLLIPTVIRKCLRGESIRMTKGEQTRDFNYVDDIVDGFIRAGITPGALGEIINIGSGVETRIADVVELIFRVIGYRLPVDNSLPYRSGEVMHFFCDNSKAKEILRWSPHTDLEEGISRTVKWFREYLYPSTKV